MLDPPITAWAVCRGRSRSHHLRACGSAAGEQKGDRLEILQSAQRTGLALPNHDGPCVGGRFRPNLAQNPRAWQSSDDPYRRPWVWALKQEKTDRRGAVDSFHGISAGVPGCAAAACRPFDSLPPGAALPVRQGPGRLHRPGVPPCGLAKTNLRAKSCLTKRTWPRSSATLAIRLAWGQPQLVSLVVSCRFAPGSQQASSHRPRSHPPPDRRPTIRQCWREFVEANQLGIEGTAGRFYKHHRLNYRRPIRFV